VTQGYCGPDLRLVDNYSGPSSCLWSLRSLILAFMAPADAPLWVAPPEALPIDRGDYVWAIPEIGWRIVGDAASGDVRIVRGDAAVDQAPNLGTVEAFGALRRLASAVLWRPFRPENNAAKYGLPVYSSRQPFCGCAEGVAP
jgi:hypothetical protein